MREGLGAIRHPNKNGQQTAVDEGLGFRTRGGNSVATNRWCDQEMREDEILYMMNLDPNPC